jgi:hypothetical protein
MLTRLLWLPITSRAGVHVDRTMILRVPKNVMELLDLLASQESLSSMKLLTYTYIDIYIDRKPEWKIDRAVMIM